MRSTWIAISAVLLVAIAGAVAQYTPVKAEDTVATLQATDLTVADDATITDDVTVGGLIAVTPTAANWTDGSTNSLVEGVYLISGTGGANDTTNTVVLANPAVAGAEVTIIMAAGTTNLITIADSGNVAASGAILLDANDVVVLQAATTSLWVEKGGSDN